MASNFCFTGTAMQCEWCHSNLASFKFADSYVDESKTKVVCAGCHHVLSLSCIRQDLTDLHQRIVAIQKHVGAEGDEKSAASLGTVAEPFGGAMPPPMAPPPARSRRRGVPTPRSPVSVSTDLAPRKPP